MASLTPAFSNQFYSAQNQKYHRSRRNDQYKNDNAVENVIRYVTRAGQRQDRKNELFCWGSSHSSPYVTPEDCICQFRFVQQRMRGDKKTDTKIVHEILCFTDQEEQMLMLNPQLLFFYGYACADMYYLLGHQCVFGIHYGMHHNEDGERDKRLHIHFAMNSVSYVTGNLWHSQLGSKRYTSNGVDFFTIPYGTKQRESQMNRMLYNQFFQCENPYETDYMHYFDQAYSLYPRNPERKEVQV